MKKLYIYLNIILVFVACKHEITTPTNPCANYTAPSAIVHLDMLYDTYEYIEIPTRDNITAEQFLQFRSPFKGKEFTHTWYIGSEILNTASVQRDFNKEKLPQNYTIYHVLRWKPNKFCNPNDIGYDSTSFSFRISNKFLDMNIMGKYRIKYDTSATNDSSDIEFYFSKRQYADSIVKNPINGPFGIYDGDLGPAEGSSFRVKGIPIYNHGILGYLDSKIDGTQNFVLSNNFLKLNPINSRFNGAEFIYNKEKNTITGYFRNGNYINNEFQKVLLKGRKIN